jgi:signal transduction histidine kinase
LVEPNEAKKKNEPESIQIPSVSDTIVIKDSIGKTISASDKTNDANCSGQVVKKIEDLDRYMEILTETAQDINEGPDLADSIDQELISIGEALGFDFTIFRMIEGGNIPKMFCSGIDFIEGRMLLESSLADGIPLFQSVESGNPFASGDLENDSRVSMKYERPRAIICLPMDFQSGSYGCAIFGCHHTLSDIKGIQKVLQVFCDQVAASYRHGKLNHRSIRRDNELQLFHDASKALSGTPDHNEVVLTIMQKANQAVSAENCGLFELDPKSGKLRCTQKVCRTPIAVEDMEIEMGEGITGRVAQTGQGVLLERAGVKTWSKEDEPSTVISVPVKFGDELLGVITLEKHLGVPFTSREYTLIEMFSVLAAAAITNSNAFTRVNEKASRQQVFNILLTHDVANYNVPIHGFLEMLLTDPKLDERQRRYVKSALAQSENISSLISDVRKLWKLRATEQTPLLEVDLSSILAEAIHDIQKNALYGDIQILYRTPPGDFKVNADSFLKDVFYNLLSNACKYGDQKPIEVTVTDHQEDEREFYRIAVADHGRGIPEERKKFLFRRFDQLDSESAAEGHGLGLSVVNALAERYGGRVWVDDRERGDFSKGSVFSLIIPKVR